MIAGFRKSCGGGVFSVLLVTCAFAPAATRHVSSSGSGSPPYGSWATAAKSIQAALTGSTAGDLVLVTNGTYTSAVAQVALVTNNIRLQSVNGPALTTIDGSDARRCLVISNTAAGAFISGFTLTRGRRTALTDHGGAVNMSQGTLSNCVIRSSRATGYGGGIYMTAGTVMFCTVTNNTSVEWNYGAGGGIYMTGPAVVRNSIIVSNLCLAYTGGGGIYCNNGTIENCLILRNKSDQLAEDHHGPGGGVRLVNGLMQHCTLVGNWSHTSGGGLYQDGGATLNCIIRDNTIASHNLYLYENIRVAGGTVTHSCSGPAGALSGTGNHTWDPIFVNSLSDFRLIPSSPCVDTGTNTGAVVQDLAGATRPTDGNGNFVNEPDMGCYEMPDTFSRPFACGFQTSTNEGLAALSARFTAGVAGTNQTISHYSWNFGDGAVQSGPAIPVVTHAYTAGWYTVTLAVTNTSLEAATFSRSQHIRVAGPVAYVSTNGGHVPPFASPGTAATNPLPAVLAAFFGSSAATSVRIGPGTYTVTNPIPLNRGIVFRSTAGPSSTSIRVSGNFRCVDLAHSNAVLDGLKLQGPDWSYLYYWGGAVQVRYGTVTNCIIENTHIGSRGGGLYQYGGLVTHCLFRQNWVHEWNYGYGGAVYITAGLLRFSRFHNNYTLSQQGGGAIYMTGGIVRNCLFYTNRASRADAVSYGRGGAIRQAGGLVESCTIAGNYSYGPGGGIYLTAGSVTNSIVYHNLVDPATATAEANFYVGGGSIGYTCATPLPTGPGNTLLDPEFTEPSLRNYSIPSVSPCADAGTNLGWMSVSRDFGGTNRIVHGRVDIGAYESPDPTVGPLTCTFSAPVTEGFTSLAVVFTADVGGSDTNITWFGWDFDNNGSWDRSGPGLGKITNSYVSGYYDVHLRVTNISLQSAQTTKMNYVLVAPSVMYVGTNATADPPYMTWGAAAGSIQDAIMAASSLPASRTEVRIAPGVYPTLSQIGLSKPVRLVGVAGPASTVVQSSGSVRCFQVNHTNAALVGLKITGCNNQGASFDAGGVYMYNGTISNCWFAGNVIGGRGGAIYMVNGLVTCSLFTQNRCTEWQYGFGGAIYMTGGSVVRSRFLGNRTDSHQGGGAIYQDGGLIRNCLFVTNAATRTQVGYEGDGGAVLQQAGVLESSTLVYNHALKEGGGVKVQGASGGITNCIIYFNSATSGVQNVYNTARVSWSCSPDLAHGVAGNMTNAPSFNDIARGDYVLVPWSGGFNAGLNLPWMQGSGTDLAGMQRIRKNVVDMGAFEYYPPVGTTLVVR